jgi:hypothetical protein
MPKKENNRKSFAAREKWLRAKRANRPVQYWDRNIGGNACGTALPKRSVGAIPVHIGATL